MPTKTFELMRHVYIDAILARHMFVRRYHLMDAFDIAEPTASKDLTNFARLHPKRVYYNTSKKRYETLVHVSVYPQFLRDTVLRMVSDLSQYKEDQDEV